MPVVSEEKVGHSLQSLFLFLSLSFIVHFCCPTAFLSTFLLHFTLFVSEVPLTLLEEAKLDFNQVSISGHWFAKKQKRVVLNLCFKAILFL